MTGAPVCASRTRVVEGLNSCHAREQRALTQRCGLGGVRCARCAECGCGVKGLEYRLIPAPPGTTTSPPTRWLSSRGVIWLPSST